MTPTDDWGKESGVECVVCPDCAFTFSDEHHDADGWYSCPNCEVCPKCDGSQTAALRRVLDHNIAADLRDIILTEISRLEAK